MGARHRRPPALTVALRLGVDTLVTYDRELAVAARSAGLEGVQPA